MSAYFNSLSLDTSVSLFAIINNIVVNLHTLLCLHLEISSEGFAYMDVPGQRA